MKMKDRIRANYQQRKRVIKLNKGFDELKKVLEMIQDASKISTLTKACQYIKELTEILENDGRDGNKCCEVCY